MPPFPRTSSWHKERTATHFTVKQAHFDDSCASAGKFVNCVLTHAAFETYLSRGPQVVAQVITRTRLGLSMNFETPCITR
jgi:hypothetical protein